MKMLNKEEIINLLHSKAVTAISSFKLSEGIDKKLVVKITAEIGKMYAKTNGSAQAAKSLAAVIATKYDDSAEAKAAIKNILDIKV